MSAEWRTIAGFPAYAVSSDGEVKRVRKIGRTGRVGTVLQPWIDGRTGYPTVSLCDGERAHKRTVHSLVCEAFHGPAPSPVHEVAHGDGHRANCRASNLRWATHAENMADMLLHDTHIRGVRHPGAKLTDNDVILIRAAKGPRGIQTRLAERYGVSVSLISLIRKGQHRSYIGKDQ